MEPEVDVVALQALNQLAYRVARPFAAGVGR